VQRSGCRDPTRADRFDRLFGSGTRLERLPARRAEVLTMCTMKGLA
jgi:hypothetical protein